MVEKRWKQVHKHGMPGKAQTLQATAGAVKDKSRKELAIAAGSARSSKCGCNCRHISLPAHRQADRDIVLQMRWAGTMLALLQSSNKMCLYGAAKEERQVGMIVLGQIENLARIPLLRIMSKVSRKMPS